MDKLTELIIPLANNEGKLTVKTAQPAEDFFTRLLTDVKITHCDGRVRIARPSLQKKVLICTGCLLRLEIGTAVENVGDLRKQFEVDGRAAAAMADQLGKTE